MVSFLAPCPNHFGTALPIYTIQNKRFFSSWVRFQFLIGTPSLHLFAIILHDILRVKCDLNRIRKSHNRLSKETDRHLGEMRKKYGKRNVTQCFVNNFKQLPFFFLLPVPLLLDLSFSCLHFCRNFFIYSPDLALCNF